MSKYQETMSHIKVDDEMKKRILQNVQEKLEKEGTYSNDHDKTGDALLMHDGRQDKEEDIRQEGKPGKNQADKRDIKQDGKQDCKPGKIVYWKRFGAVAAMFAGMAIAVSAVMRFAGGIDSTAPAYDAAPAYEAESAYEEEASYEEASEDSLSEAESLYEEEPTYEESTEESLSEAGPAYEEEPTYEKESSYEGKSSYDEELSSEEASSYEGEFSYDEKPSESANSFDFDEKSSREEAVSDNFDAADTDELEGNSIADNSIAGEADDNTASMKSDEASDGLAPAIEENTGEEQANEDDLSPAMEDADVEPDVSENLNETSRLNPLPVIGIILGILILTVVIIAVIRRKRH